MPNHLNIVTAKPINGGVITFARHLAIVFERAGWTVDLIKLCRQRRKFQYGDLEFRGVDPADVKDTPTLMISNARVETGEIVMELLSRVKSAMILHDPRSVNGEKCFDLSSMCKQIVVIRRAIQHIRPGAVWLRHPFTYDLSETEPASRDLWAISHSRVDFDKDQKVMLAANALLPPEKQIAIYCQPSHTNRFYAHMVLSKKWPDWEGPIDFEDPIKLCRRAVFDVDLTRIQGDGGGTQYTFLEACVAGTVPILYESWITPNSDLVVGENVLTCSDSESLFNVLSSEDVSSTRHIVENNKRLLARHDGGEWVKLMGSYR